MDCIRIYKDLIIGTVSEVTTLKNETVPIAFITPEADFTKLENVMILNNFKKNTEIPKENKNAK